MLQARPHAISKPILDFGEGQGQHFKCKFVATASFIVGPKPDKTAEDGHRSIAV
jgi:hypothetical protein